MTGIGKLIEVDVRELWKHEQYDFSDWLAKKDNIEYLGDRGTLLLSWMDNNNSKNNKRQKQRPPVLNVPLS